ncbi:hypothetical protein D0Z66_04745 [Cereibacter sphaeroides]|nr:hypothetical protein D0Z66_04745 [Cereibacter sphaeroides]
MIDVSVWPEPGDTFMVSDDGAAHFEVTSGAFSERAFQAVARAQCANYGALFDGGTMLFMRVAAHQLRGAIISMATLIKEVVDETVARSIKAKAESSLERLYERLDMAFDASKVAHDAEVIGASTAGYRVDALVRAETGDVVFDLFTKDPNSVSSTFTKLSDIYRLDDGPKLVAVTRDPDAVGPKLQLISSVAPVIRLDSAVEVFRKQAA